VTAVDSIRCHLCGDWIKIPSPVGFELVPVDESGWFVPPIHDCAGDEIDRELMAERRSLADIPNYKVVQEPLSDHPNFAVLKESQRVMSYAETTAMLQRLGLTGQSVLKAMSVN
jgi:hypothetical protein